jgi:hypothetical protein
MNNDNQQESENNLKTISRIEVKHRPPSFEEQKGNNAQDTLLFFNTVNILTLSG